MDLGFWGSGDAEGGRDPALSDLWPLLEMVLLSLITSLSKSSVLGVGQGELSLVWEQQGGSVWSWMQGWGGRALGIFLRKSMVALLGARVIGHSSNVN